MVSWQSVSRKTRAVTKLGIAFAVSAIISGCGGGGGSTPAGNGAGPGSGGVTPPRAADITPVTRSVRLNSYNSWGLTSTEDHQNPVKLQEALVTLAKHDDVVLSDSDAFNHETPGWDMAEPGSIKRLNPTAKVYYYYAVSKCSWEDDMNKPASQLPARLNVASPIPWWEIQSHDWWLRDSSGNILQQDSEHYMVDLAKPGLKERFLECLRARLAGKGADGVILDYLPSDLSIPGFAAFSRPTAYPTDTEWFDNAYVPFVNYVYDALHSDGYKLVCGCVDYSRRGTPQVAFIRSKVDVVIYESWICEVSGSWRPQDEVAQRIVDFNQDPLECWAADFGLRQGIAEYDRKQNAALAMYYVSIPASQANRSYHHYGQLAWDAVWDLNIGDPAADAVKMDGSYFWSRKFTNGIVLFNYEDSGTISYTLDKTYKDVSGHNYSGTISVPSRTGMILAAE